MCVWLSLSLSLCACVCVCVCVRISLRVYLISVVEGIVQPPTHSKQTRTHVKTMEPAQSCSPTICFLNTSLNMCVVQKWAANVWIWSGSGVATEVLSTPPSPPHPLPLYMYSTMHPCSQYGHTPKKCTSPLYSRIGTHRSMMCPNNDLINRSKLLLEMPSLILSTSVHVSLHVNIRTPASAMSLVSLPKFIMCRCLMLRSPPRTVTRLSRVLNSCCSSSQMDCASCLWRIWNPRQRLQYACVYITLTFT